MPDELKAKAQEAASRSGRSLHAELIARLAESFEPSNRLDDVVKHMAHQLAESELRAAKFELLAETRGIDLVLAGDKLAGLLEADTTLAAKIMTREEQDNFVLAYNNAYEELQEGGQDVESLVKKFEVAARNLQISRSMLKRPRTDQAKLAKARAARPAMVSKPQP